MALSAMARNKLRSLLSMLGVIIGVGAVILRVHLGQGATESVRQQIASLGQNLLLVRPGAGGHGPGGLRAQAEAFTAGDVDATVRQLPEARVAPTTNAAAVVVHGNENIATTVTGTSAAFFAVRDWAPLLGRVFDEGEQRSAATVCVLGQAVREALFGAASPLGVRVRVGKVPCTVIGVLESKQAAMGSDPDNTVLMPLRTVQRRLAGRTDVDMVFVSARDAASTSRVHADIERLLRERRRIRPGEQDDFSVRDMKEIADRVAGTTKALTALLGAIAAVSLVVGGIGIMNIMRVSGTERTREIGIRMAIGARGREVFLKFLVEAAMLSTIGGLVGIGLGLGSTLIAVDKLDLPFALVAEIIWIAFLFSAGVGAVFGFWPARKASRLDPIEALRHE